MAHDDIQVFDPEGNRRISAVVKWAEAQMGQPPRPSQPGQMIPFQFRRFRFDVNLVPSVESDDDEEPQVSTANAHRMEYVDDVLTEVGESFAVVDITNGAARAGDMGWAIHPHDRDQWEAIHIERSIPLILEAQVNEGSGVSHTDGTFDVDNVELLWPLGADSPTESLSETLPDVINFLGFPASDDAPVLLIRGDSDSEWLAIPKPPLRQVAPVTSIDYDTSDHKFKLKKTQNTLVFQADDEDATFDIQPAWHANVLETFTVTVDGSTAGLTRSREDFYVQEVGAENAEGVPKEYLDGTVCP